MVADRLEQLKVPTEMAAEVFSQEMVENFEAEGRPPWEPLKDSTIKRKAAEGVGHKPILQRSGALFGSVAEASNWIIEEQGRGQVVAAFVDPTDYGDFHLDSEVGGRGPTKFMPIRDWTTISADGERRMTEIYQEFANEVVKEAFSGGW